MAELNQKKAQSNSAHEHKAEAEALFNSIGDGAISTDEFGKITRVNPAAEQLLGYTQDDLIGKWFPKIIVAVTFDDKQINLLDRPITKAFLLGKPVAEKTFYRKKDGQKIAVSVNASPILFKDKPLGAIEVFRDITFEEEVDRMKSEFISLASHQLRTPLSAIKTYTHMLHDGYMGKLSIAQKKSLATIIIATDRMNKLISTLLNVTRIESGKIDVNFKTVQLDKLVDEVTKELAMFASNKSIVLTHTTKGKASTTIKTDSLIVKEIMINLLSNAIKYTPDSGKVKVVLNPKRNDVIIEVHDSGWGIPKYSHDQIFSKFFRAPNIVERETTGTGLGLYLVKGLLDTLGGDIWFESDEAKGTSFYFSLPRTNL